VSTLPPGAGEAEQASSRGLNTSTTSSITFWGVPARLSPTRENRFSVPNHEVSLLLHGHQSLHCFGSARGHHLQDLVGGANPRV
jgi:hypothetical protein